MADLDHDINVRLEALKLVKDWSSGAVVVQSVAVGAVGAILTETPTGWHLFLAVALLVVLVASVYVGAVAVAGTIPYIAQNLVKSPACDIYQQTGGMTRGGLARAPLGKLCLLQARLFTLSMFLFAAFALAQAFHKPSGTAPMKCCCPTNG